MATLIGSEPDARTLLTNLVLLDYDAIAAYEAAIERIEDPASKRALSSFRDDHVRHTRNLALLVEQLGGEAPTGGDAKQLLTTGKVALGHLFGDKAILEAMRSNEDDTNTAYSRAVEHSDVTVETRQTLEGNLADERRHCAWILERLKSL